MKSRVLAVIALAYFAGAFLVAGGFVHKFFRGERNRENRLILKRVAVPTAIASLIFGIMVAMFEGYLFRQQPDMGSGIILLLVLSPVPLRLFLQGPVDINEHQASVLVISVVFYALIFAVITGLLMFVFVKARENK